MKNILLALLLLVSSCIAPTPTDARGGPSPVGRAFHATVALQTESGRTYCSGVIVENVVLTAYHCISHGQEVFVRDARGTWWAEVVSRDPIHDLAILVPVLGRALPQGVKVARKAPTWGDDIWVIGHPLGEYEFTITRGIVGHPRREDGGLFGGTWMQHDAGVLGGNSGGPVLNKHGRLVGITSFGIIEPVYCGVDCQGIFQGTHINGAVHLSAILAILR